MQQRKGICFKTRAAFADGCGASCWPGSLSPGQPAWRLVSRQLSCWARSRPGQHTVWALQSEDRALQVWESKPPRGLWHLSRGLRGQSLQATQGFASGPSVTPVMGLPLQGPLPSGPASLTVWGPLGLRGPGARPHGSEAWWRWQACLTVS